jgi:uncharacterized protein YjbI with pentapeptide repeats
MSSELLDEILGAHRQWVESGEIDGTRADLQGAILRGANLKKSDLRKANLVGADLTQAELAWADLREAELLNACLHEADLQGADLSDAQGLLPAALGGADLTGAKLPEEIIKFEELKTVETAAGSAQNLFVSLLLVCVYIWLTVAATRDVQLLTNSGTASLPIIGTAIPVVTFYCLVPVLLLVLHIYLHLTLQRLWEAVADLPAVFPDGKSLPRRAYLWLLSGLVAGRFTRLQVRRSSLLHLQQWLTALILWWTVPATLLVVWARYLLRRDWVGTVAQIGCLTVSVVAAIGFYALMTATLSRRAERHRGWTKSWLLGLAIAALVSGAFWWFSESVINGIRYDFAEELNRVQRLAADRDRRGVSTNSVGISVEGGIMRIWVPRILTALYSCPFGNLESEDVSTRPADSEKQKGEEEEMSKNGKEKVISGEERKTREVIALNAELDAEEARTKLVKGAKLRGQNLRYLNAYRAFFVNADLGEASLQSAILLNADLRRAYLSKADLRGAVLEGADLRLSNLANAKLNGIQLRYVKLDDTYLRGADLSEAVIANTQTHRTDFTEACLWRADLSDTRLGTAMLNRANLCSAKLIGADLRGSRDLAGTDLTETNLKRARLEGADLRNAKGLTWEQIVKAEIDCTTKLPDNLEKIKNDEKKCSSPKAARK